MATVIDCYSREVVAWSVTTHLRTGLVKNALRNALAAHPPQPGVIFYLDRGCQYTSHEFRRFCGRRHTLYISETTAKFHVRNILRKLDSSSCAESVYEASKMVLV